jgi:hypothetical protein
MFERIQQAESAIKAGDTKTGFEILRQLLAKDPESERAWWIMSGLVQREQRTKCLEQVLRINPDNQLARETLEKLLSSPSKPETKPPRQIPSPPTPEPDQKSTLQTFLFSKGSRNYLTILGEKRLIRAQAETDHLVAVNQALKKGEIPDRYLTEMKTISLDSIQAARQKGAVLQVTSLDEEDERTLRLPFEDQNKAKVVLSVLTKKLGPRYMVQTRPLNTGISLAISAILTLSAVGFSAWTLWGVQQININLGVDRESLPMAAALLDALGNFGVILLCAAAIMLALGISAWLLLKPPVSTELVRRV